MRRHLLVLALLLAPLGRGGRGRRAARGREDPRRLAAVRRRRGVRLVLADELRHGDPEPRQPAHEQGHADRPPRRAAVRDRRRRRQPLDRRLRHVAGSSVSTGHAEGREADPRRRQRLGRRVRVRLGLGDEQLRRLGLADQPGHEPGRQDDQDRRPAQQLRGRRDAIWVGSNAPSGQDIFRIDPATNTSTAVPIGHDSPSGIIVSADAVWTANGDDTVTRIDPATKAVVATVKVGSAAGSRARWRPTGRSGSRTSTTNTISVIDPETNAVVAHGQDRARPVRRPRAASATCGSAATEASDLWRIRP